MELQPLILNSFDTQQNNTLNADDFYDICFCFPTVICSKNFQISSHQVCERFNQICRKNYTENAYKIKTLSKLPSIEKTNLSLSYHELLTIIRKSFIQFLTSVGCYIQKFRYQNLLFYTVRLSEDAAKILAHKSHYTLQLIPKYVNQHNQILKLTPYIVYDKLAEEQRKANNEDVNIFQMYDILGKPVYQETASLNEHLSLFRPIDRVRLLMNQINYYYDLSAMIKCEVMQTYYMLHQSSAKAELNESWSSLSNITKLHKQPIESIRIYYGEEIAFYFLWLGTFTEWLQVPAIVGLALFIAQIFCQNKPYNYICNIVTLFHSVYVTIWTTLFLKDWQQKEMKYCISWGLDEHSRNHTRRLKCQNSKTNFNAVSLAARHFISFCVSSLVFILTMLMTCCLFFLPNIIQQYPAYHYPVIQPFILPLVSVINVVLVTVFDSMWCNLALTLTEFEKCLYEDDFQRSHVFKLYMFRFINTFSSFFYITCLKTYFNPSIDNHSCIELLKWNLGTLFLANFGQNFIELLTPTCFHYWRQPDMKCTTACVCTPQYDYETYSEISLESNPPNLDSKNHNSPLKKPSFLTVNQTIQWQKDYYYVDYSFRGDFVEDYMEITLQFAFIALFSLVLPIIPFFAYISNLLEIRSDAFKLVNLHRRVFPNTSTGIGAWNNVLLATTYIGVVVTVGITLLLFEIFPGYKLTLFEKILLFLFLEHVGVLLILMIRVVLPRETHEVQLLRENINNTIYESKWAEASEKNTFDKTFGFLPSSVKSLILQ